MGNAVLNGIPFRIDPTSISWPFTVKTSSTKTVGGKVLQVFGTQLGDMTVAGTFGVGGTKEQREFLDRMKKLGDNQMDRFPVVSPNPYRFLWPSRGWDFQVWLKQFSEPGASASINESNANISPKWTLKLFIASDNLDLKKVATDVFIDRLSDGIGWKRSKYNGPMGFEEVSAALGRTGVTDVKSYLNAAFGISDTAVLGNVNADGTTGSTPTGGTTPPDRGSFDRVTWAIDFLKGLGKPVTTENKVGIVAWTIMEGGHTGNSATWNPLCTTKRYQGKNVPMGGNFGQNGGTPVQAYPTYAIGLEMTIATLNGGANGYAQIRAALDAGTSAEAIADAIGHSSWGTANGVRNAIPSARRLVGA